jgi:hypothetical protein
MRLYSYPLAPHCPTDDLSSQPWVSGTIRNTEKKLENLILGEPLLQLRTCRALLLTASRLLETVLISQTFGMRYGFCLRQVPLDAKFSS